MGWTTYLFIETSDGLDTVITVNVQSKVGILGASHQLLPLHIQTWYTTVYVSTSKYFLEVQQLTEQGGGK